MANNVKKLLLLSATALLSTAGIASCGVTGGGSEDLDLTVDTRGASITLWTGFGTSVSSALQTVLDEFTAATEINVTHETQGGYDNLNSAINLSASTCTYPNVAVGYPDHFASYIDSDIQLRLDPYIEQDKNIPATREDGFVELPKFDLSDFYSDYLIENQTLEFDENGKGYTLGIPFNKSTEVMVYNKTFFENPLVIAEGISVPETWDQVKTVCQKILNFVKGKNAYGKVLGSDGNTYTTLEDLPESVTTLLDLTAIAEGGLIPFSYDSQPNLFITGIRQWGGQYTEVDTSTRRGYIVFDNQATRDSLTKFKSIYDDGSFGIPQSFGESSYCSAHFKIYQSLMNVGSSAGMSNYPPTGDAFECGVAPVPYNSTDNKYVISQGTNLALFDIGTNVERAASWKLLKYLSQVKNGEFAALTGYFPACKSAYNSEDYQAFINDTAGTSTDKLNRAAAKVNADIYNGATTGWHKFVDPGFNGSSTIRTSVGTITAEVFIDNTSIDSVIASHYETLIDYQRSN